MPLPSDPVPFIRVTVVHEVGPMALSCCGMNDKQGLSTRLGVPVLAVTEPAQIAPGIRGYQLQCPLQVRSSECTDSVATALGLAEK
jgi:hypothetical protein